MHSVTTLTFGLMAALIGQTFAVPMNTMHTVRMSTLMAPVNSTNTTEPTVVTPGTAANIIITDKNTVNGTIGPANGTNTTSSIYSEFRVDTAAAASGVLPCSFVNNLGGAVNAYVTGADVNNKLVMLQPNGAWFYPQASTASTPQPITGNVAIPLSTTKGSSTKISMPGYISSGRIWFAQGNLQFFTVNNGNGQASLVTPSAVNPSDPSADINWGFVELTNTAAGGLYADISYVDFVGLVLGMELQTSGNAAVQSTQGLSANAVSSICGNLKTQAASDGQPWGSLCQVSSSGAALRVVAPSDYTSLKSSAFSSLYTNYINQVWTQYSTNTLTIATQGSAGNVACKVSNNLLTCAGDNRGYAKPSASDIFGCNSGPFAIEATDNAVHAAVVPRLCAAFDRSTLLLTGGNIQPGLSSSSYYTVSPTNYYSKFVHQYEVDGRGYAFAYDDVNPAGQNEAGVVTATNPQLLTVLVGGPS